MISLLNKHRKKETAISPMIPEQIVEEIKSRNDIVSVVEQYVTLDRKSAANYFGLCPFHREDTPSFSVSPSKQIFYCFGCHKGGNVVQFICEIEKVAYPQALRMLAERANISLPEPDDDAWREKSEKNKRIQSIMLDAARWYYKTLIGEKGTAARLYLQKRQISTSTAKKFGLGYALDEWDSLLQHLRSLSYNEDDLLISGLFKRTRQGGIIDLFRNRLIFPIFDVLGRVVAFGGRVMDESLPKYINSPETPIYTKGRHLYALNLARSSRRDNLIIVEGYLDAISMHQAGIDNAVASLGTALTEQQALLIRKYTESVIIGFDADAAGQQAALRGLDILSARNLNVSVLIVPDGKDPDDYIKRNGPERFNALIDKSLPLLDFKLFTARKTFESEKGLNIIGYQDAACEILSKEENSIVRELYAEKLAELLKISQVSVINEINRRRLQPGHNKEGDLVRHQLQNQQEQLKTKQQENMDNVNREELYLLALLAAKPDCWNRMNVKPSPQDFSEGTIQSLFISALPMIAKAEFDTAKLMDMCEEIVIRGRKLSELMAKASIQLDDIIGHQDWLKPAQQWLQRMKIQQTAHRKKILERELNETDDPEQIRILREKLLELSNEYSSIREKYNLEA